jgi:hypothetical protein
MLADVSAIPVRRGKVPAVHKAMPRLRDVAAELPAREHLSGKTHSMPTQDDLRSDDGNGVKDARTATIEPNEQGTVRPTQMQSTCCAPLQDTELMPQNQNFGFQPPSRLEAVAQHADDKNGN